MRNPRESQSTGARFRLAAKLLGSLAAMALLNGCLLPQDDVLGFIPTRKNLPPLILDTGRRPIQQAATVPIEKSCGLPIFQLLVEDDSPSLSHLWFINPSPEHKTGVAGFRGDENGKVRTLVAPFGLRESVTKLPPGTPAVVEVVITDGQFMAATDGSLTIEPQETGIDERGQVVDQEPFRVSYSWFVTPDTSPCP